MPDKRTGAEKLVAALMRHKVSSLSPHTGMTLIAVEEKVLIAARAEKDAKTKQLLTAYAKALRAVCNVALLQQAVVIAQLEALLGTEEGGDS